MDTVTHTPCYNAELGRQSVVVATKSIKPTKFGFIRRRPQLRFVVSLRGFEGCKLEGHSVVNVHVPCVQYHGHRFDAMMAISALDYARARATACYFLSTSIQGCHH